MLTEFLPNWCSFLSVLSYEYKENGSIGFSTVLFKMLLCMLSFLLSNSCDCSSDCAVNFDFRDFTFKWEYFDFKLWECDGLWSIQWWGMLLDHTMCDGSLASTSSMAPIKGDGRSGMKWDFCRDISLNSSNDWNRGKLPLFCLVPSSTVWSFYSFD